MTPAVLFFSGTVNPSALEIASGLCLWSAGIAWLFDKRLGRPCAWVAAIAGSVLAQTRPGSLPLLVLLAITFALLSARFELRSWMLPVGISAFFGVTWTLVEQSWNLGTQKPVPASYSTAHITSLSMRQLGGYMHEMVGVFGAPTPTWTLYAWLLVTGFLIYLGWSLGNFRLRSTLALLLLGLLVVPVIFNLAEAPTVGVAAGHFGAYQSRYLMPYSLGLPLVAAYGLAGADWRAPSVAVAGVLGIGQLAMFVEALHRYSAGANASAMWFSGGWDPPYVGLIAPVIIFALALSMLLAGTWRMGARDTRPGAAPGGPSYAPTPSSSKRRQSQSTPYVGRGLPG